MITAIEAEKIGLVNKVVKLTEKEFTVQDAMVGTTTTTTYGKGPQQQQQPNEKQRSRELSQILNRKLMEESVSFAKEITKNSYNAIKISKVLVNKGIDAPIETGLRLEIYGMALSFAHSDRKKMMSAFLNKKV